MKRLEKLFILKSFIIWRVALIVVAILAIKYIPVFSYNFFGGRYINYVTNPIFWGWANFDGEHYLSIAMFGYKDLQLAFFPGYPLLMNILSRFLGSNISSYLWSGIIISNSLFLGSIFILRKIVMLDYSKKIANISILLLILFPTSFYFGAVYSESLFLFLSLLTYYFYRKNKFLLVGFVGVLMTLTRLYGVLIILMIGIDILTKKTKLIKIIQQKIYLIGISMTGIFTYMWYCWLTKGDVLAFYTLQTKVGEQRSDHLILLPQVFYRYFVRIIPNLKWNYFPVVFTTLLEVFVAILFLIIIIYSFKKIRWDYWIYLLLGYLVPTLTGSFSSLPRYVIVLFPAFIIVSILFEKTNKYLRLGIYLIMTIIAIIAQMLFFRGYFVS